MVFIQIQLWCNSAIRDKHALIHIWYLQVLKSAIEFHRDGYSKSGNLFPVSSDVETLAIQPSLQSHELLSLYSAVAQNSYWVPPSEVGIVHHFVIRERHYTTPCLHLSTSASKRWVKDTCEACAVNSEDMKGNEKILYHLDVIMHRTSRCPRGWWLTALKYSIIFALTPSQIKMLGKHGRNIVRAGRRDHKWHDREGTFCRAPV